MVGEVERWRGAASAQDDISIVAVEVSFASGPVEPRASIASRSPGS